MELFNGKNLTGWVNVGIEKWTLGNGAIHGQGISEKGDYRRTEKEQVYELPSLAAV